MTDAAKQDLQIKSEKDSLRNFPKYLQFTLTAVGFF